MRGRKGRREGSNGVGKRREGEEEVTKGEKGKEGRWREGERNNEMEE